MEPMGVNRALPMGGNAHVAPPCGSERGFAPMTVRVVSKLSRLNPMPDSSVVIFIGDSLSDRKLHWSVRADPCVVKIVVFSKTDDWNCAVLAPTPMEVQFGNGGGYIKQLVDMASKAKKRPWDALSNQIFWRGSHHIPHSCARLLNPGERDPRGHVVKLSETAPWLNASFEKVPPSVFLQHRYLLDLCGVACTTCVLPPSAFAASATRRAARGPRSASKRQAHARHCTSDPLPPCVKHVHLNCTSDPLPSHKTDGMHCGGSLPADAWCSR
jgi:hypothetical protein